MVFWRQKRREADSNMKYSTLLTHFRNFILMTLTILLFASCVPAKKEVKQNTSIPSQLAKNDGVPTAPTVTSPAYNPFTTGASEFAISGVCTTDNMVSITGSSAQAVKCVNSAYSFVVKESTDATYSYVIAQKSPSGVISAKTNFVWTRSQTVSPVVITSPPASPYLSNQQTLTMAGTCTPGMLVAASGDYTGSVECNSKSTFAFAAIKTTDGIYSFDIIQTDSLANLSSAPFSLNWTLDTTAPLAPTLVTPAITPYTSTASSVTITVGCEEGDTVTVTGDKQASGVCSANAYTFSDTRAAFGTYNYSFTQTDLAGNTSPALAFQWNYEATFVPPVSISTPVASDPANPITKYVSKESMLVLKGTCLTGNAVELTGAATQTATCAAGFEFNIDKSSVVTDGTYSFLLLQRDSNTGTPSASIQFIWTRDITAPNAITLVSPDHTPYIAASLAVVVGCDTDNGVDVSGVNSSNGLTFSASGACVGSQFSFVDNTQIADGTITYTIKQTDLAMNASSGFDFIWVRDTRIPDTPSISFEPTSPTTPITPSRSDMVVVTGTCGANHVVNLSGDVQSTEVTSGYLYQTCSTNNSYSFTVDKTLDTNLVRSFVFNVDETNLINGLSSTVNSGTWTRDKEALVPSISVPTSGTFNSSGSLSVQGACETGATVYLKVNSIADQNISCVNSAFTFNLTRPDATYTYAVNQVDYAGNISAFTANRTWIVLSTAPPDPTILVPAATPNPYISNGSLLSVSGICENSDLVEISGDINAGTDLQSPGVTTATHTCTGSVYSYNILKTTDGTYAISVKQTNNVPLDSGVMTRFWLRDATAPVISVGTTTPTGVKTDTVFPTPSPTPTVANSNLQYAAQINFSATDMTNVSHECKLDNGTYSPCSSPSITYNSINVAGGTLTEGTYHSVYIKATDAANNQTIQQVNWFQRAYNTLALFHFEEAAVPGVDSSNYIYSSVAGNYSPNGTFKFGSKAARFTGTTAGTVANNIVLDTGATNQATIEMWTRFSGLPATGSYMVIASKTGGAGNYGWEFGINSPSANNYKFYFAATTDKNSAPTMIYSTVIPSTSLAIGTYYHVAVTFDSATGSIGFYFAGNAKIDNSVGNNYSKITAAPLSASTAPLLFANSTLNTTYTKYNGRIDEFRWSRVIRYTGSTTYTIPSVAFTAD